MDIFRNRKFYLFLAIVLIIFLNLVGIFFSYIVSLGLVVMLGFIIYYFINSNNTFWMFLFLLPFIPPYFAFSISESLPLLSGYRLFLLLLLFDQLILKKRFNMLLSTIKNDRFLILIFIYLLGIEIPSFYEFFKNQDNTALVGGVAVVFEKILVYFLVIVNIQLSFKKIGKNETLMKTLHIFSLSAGILSVLGIIEYISSFNLFTLLDISNRSGVSSTAHIRMGELRVSTSFAHSLGYGLYLLLMIPIACYQVKKYKNNNRNRYYFNSLLVLLLIINVLFTASRSTLLALIISAIVAFLIMNIRKKIIYFYLALFIGGPLLIFSITPIAKDLPIISNIGSNVQSLSDTLIGTRLTDNFGANEDPFVYRNKLIDYAFHLPGTENIFGKGIGFIRKEPLVFNLPELNPYGPTISYSVDNYYINIKLELGWIGFLITLFVIVIFLIKLVKYRTHNDFFSIILVSFSGYLFALTMVDELDTMKYLWILLGLFSAFINDKYLYR